MPSPILLSVHGGRTVARGPVVKGDGLDLRRFATVQCKLTIIVMLTHAKAGQRHHRAKDLHHDSDDRRAHRSNRW